MVVVWVSKGRKPTVGVLDGLMAWSWFFDDRRGCFILMGMVFFRSNLIWGLLNIPARHFFWQGALGTVHSLGGGFGEQKCSYDIRGCHTTPNFNSSGGNM